MKPKQKQPEFQREDYVLAIGGHFKGKRGRVVRADNRSEMVCVVWKGVWDHGIWVFPNELKRTRRPRVKE